MKCRIISMFLACVVATNMYGQTAKKIINRASNQDLCLAVTIGSTPTNGVCLNGTTAASVYSPNGASAPLATSTKAGTKPVINVTTSGNSVWFGHSNSEYNGILGADSGGGTPWIGAFFYHSATSNELRRSSGTNAPVSIRFGPTGSIDFTRNAASTLDSTFTATNIGTFNSSGNFEATVRVDGSGGLGNLYSGTYTPTLTNVQNSSSNAALSAWQYMRVGNVVTVSGAFGTNMTAANADTSVGVSLPVASNFAGIGDAGGVVTQFAANAVAHPTGECVADATNDRLTVAWTSINTGTGLRTVVHCTYIIK